MRGHPGAARLVWLCAPREEIHLAGSATIGWSHLNSLTSGTEAPLTARVSYANEKKVDALRGYNLVLPLQNVYILSNTTS